MNTFCSDVEITMVETVPSKLLKRKRTTPLTSWVTSSFDSFDFLPPKTEAKSTLKSNKTDPGGSTNVIPLKCDPDDLLSDQYRPTRRGDLCVHVRKVAEVETWLRNSLSAPLGAPRILLITGPTGCGKSATVRCLCTQKDITLKEWTNPLGGNEMEKLEQFLFRSDRYHGGGIVVDSDDDHVEDSAGTIVLLEDLPPSIGDQPELLRNLLRRHALKGRVPLILILSDSTSRELSPRWILPKTILDELHIDTIRFNPVAPTQMKKALQRVADSEGRKRRGRVRHLNSSAIAELVAECGGDIRCALNRLQFILTRCPATTRRDDKKTDGEESNGRDNSLCLFRSLGKILHCKRGSSTEKNSDVFDPLPPHLACHQREPLSFNPEEVFEGSRLPGTLFASFLHENCVDFFADITDLAESVDTLSLADRIGAVWTADRTPGTQLADLYVGALAARGLAFYKRQARPVGFRPLRRPQLLSLPNIRRGTESRSLLLDLEPYRRVLKNQGRACRLTRCPRFGGSLVENDTAFEDSSSRKYKKKRLDEEEDGKMEWVIVMDDDEEEVVIDDSDS